VRRLRLALIALGVLLFLLISGLLARAFSIDGAERSAVAKLIQAQARGDQATMLRLLQNCRQSPSCRERVAQNASRLAHLGNVLIVQINPSAGFSLTSTLGTARVVWRAGSELPVTQCVRVRRAGDVISGLHIELLTISPRIQTSADCPGTSSGP
jgi:hypothetical protein